jgi:hypothetical protein
MHGRGVVGIRSRRLGSSQLGRAATCGLILHGFPFARPWARAHCLLCCPVIRSDTSRPISLELHRLVHPSISTRLSTRGRGHLARFVYRRTEGPFITSSLHRLVRFDSVVCCYLFLTCVTFI